MACRASRPLRSLALILAGVLVSACSTTEATTTGPIGPPDTGWWLSAQAGVMRAEHEVDVPGFASPLGDPSNRESVPRLQIEGGHANGWGFILNYTAFEWDRVYQTGMTRFDEDAEQQVVDVFASYRFDFSESPTKLDVYAGVRRAEFDIEATLTNPGAPTATFASRSEDEVYGVVGVRVTGEPFGGNLDWIKLYGRADVGNDTWSAAGGVGFELSEHVGIDLQYQLLSVEFDDGRRDVEVRSEGPTVSLTLRF